MDQIDRSDHLTDHAHARQDQAKAETSEREALVLYDALPACTNCKILSNGTAGHFVVAVKNSAGAFLELNFFSSNNENTYFERIF